MFLNIKEKCRKKFEIKRKCREKKLWGKMVERKWREAMYNVQCTELNAGRTCQCNEAQCSHVACIYELEGLEHLTKDCSSVHSKQEAGESAYAFFGCPHQSLVV